MNTHTQTYIAHAYLYYVFSVLSGFIYAHNSGLSVTKTNESIHPLNPAVADYLSSRLQGKALAINEQSHSYMNILSLLM